MAGLLSPQERAQPAGGLLDRPQRIDDRVAGLLGLDPNIQRGSILPFGRDASGEMVMAWPQMALDTIKSVMLPGHVMQGGEFTPRDVTEMALDVGMLSSVVPAPAGAKRMFGGINAKNAPVDDLAKAEVMEKAGEAADDIWRATGWGRGADGKWRFEIDDSGAKFNASKPDGKTLVENDLPIDGMGEGFDYGPNSLLTHDRLRDSYGSVAPKTHVINGNALRDMKGAYDGSTGAVTLVAPARAQDARSTAVHELQHAVQQREGFARGGSPQSAGIDLAEIANRAAELASQGVPMDEAKRRAFAELGDFANYKRLAGEVEARNVQTRMDMDAATRRATPPWATEDVPRDQQIVRGLLGGDGVQMSADLPMDEAARMARATEMGFDPDLKLYHATNKDFDAFDLKMSGSGSNAGNMKERAVFLTDNPAVADSYLGSVDVDAAAPSAIEHGTADLGGGVGRAYSKGGQVMPVMVRDLDFDNFEVWDYGGGGYRADEMKAALKDARKAGAKGVVFKNIKDPGIRDTIGPVGNPRKPATVVAVFDPKTIRSRFAAFDPARRDSADILASHLGVPGIGMLDSMPEEEQRPSGLLNY